MTQRPLVPVLARALGRALDARGLAVGRASAGATMLARPALLPTALGLEPEAVERSTWLVQMLGAREVALGLGALTAGRDRRSWLAAGLLSDAVDAVALTAAVRGGRVRPAAGGAVVAVAATAVVVQLDALRRR